MWLGQLRRGLVFSLVGALVGGTVLCASPRAVQTEKGHPERRKAEVDRKIETPAPRGLKVASGRGKILLFELDEKEERVPARPGVKDGPFRETQRETHWAVVTGLIDHDKVQKSLIMVRRQPVPPAEKLYRRVELERQTLRKDGTWSDWGPVDIEAILRILDNVPAIEEERVAAKFRVETLVDPLPFLTMGRWRGVDVEEYLPAEKKGPQDRPSSDDVPPRPTGMREMMLPARGELNGGPPGRGLPLGPQRERPPVLMVRSFDFTVEPGHTYRYRARVVLYNPHYDRQRPGDRKLIVGPWSEATDVVTVPAP